MTSSPVRHIRARERPCRGCKPVEQKIAESNLKISRGGTMEFSILSKDATPVPSSDLDWLFGCLVGWSLDYMIDRSSHAVMGNPFSNDVKVRDSGTRTCLACKHCSFGLGHR